MSKEEYISRFSIFVVSLALVAIALLASCSSRTYPIVVERHDTLRVESFGTIHDTLIRDNVRTLTETVFVNQYTKGDTVFVEKTTERNQGHDSIVYHPVYVTKDSIIYKTRDVEVEKVTEVNKLRWWQKALMWAGGIGLAAFGLFTAYKIKKR